MVHAVERELFRIELENRWLGSAINGLIAGAAVSAVAWFFTEQDMLLFACLGSSAASVVFAPMVKSNSLRTIILAYLIATLVSIATHVLREHTILPLHSQCFLAVGVSVFLMRLSGTMHPAAVGSALAFVVYERDLRAVSILLPAILGLLVVVKVLAYAYLEELEFRWFHKEFTRDYYGTEIGVTLQKQEIGEPESEAAS